MGATGVPGHPQIMMYDVFFILLAGGLVLAGALSRSTIGRGAAWRWAGILALTLPCAAAVALYFHRGPLISMSLPLRQIQIGLLASVVVAIIVYVVLPARWPRRATAVAVATFVLSALAGSNLLHEHMTARGTAVQLPPKLLSMIVQTLVCAAVAATAGLGLANTWLFESGNAGRPRTPDRVWFWVLALRAAVSVAGLLAAHHFRPADAIWANHGLLIAARWGIGLIIPIAILLATRRDDVRGVADWYVICGEAAALHLTRATGLPF